MDAEETSVNFPTQAMKVKFDNTWNFSPRLRWIVALKETKEILGSFTTKENVYAFCEGYEIMNRLEGNWSDHFLISDMEETELRCDIPIKEN